MLVSLGILNAKKINVLPKFVAPVVEAAPEAAKAAPAAAADLPAQAGEAPVEEASAVEEAAAEAVADETPAA